jgi:hypothetical protein
MRGGEGVIVRDLYVFSVTSLVGRHLMGQSDSGALLVNIILANAQRPYTTLRVSQLIKQRFVVRLEVFVDDDFGLVVPLCHLDWPPAEDRNPADALLRQHVVENRCANEAGCAREDEMHCCDGISTIW